MPRRKKIVNYELLEEEQRTRDSWLLASEKQRYSKEDIETIERAIEEYIDLSIEDLGRHNDQENEILTRLEDYNLEQPIKSTREEKR